jgi:hypothetical protein
MSTVPQSKPNLAPDDAPLNPALKQVRDETYGPDQEGSDPMATVSVTKDEGRYWPVIWAAVTIICVIVAIVLIVF